MTFDEWIKQAIFTQQVRTQEEWMRIAFDAAKHLERERICAAIKAEEDHCADGDYMLDSDDCISVARGTWRRPDWNGSNDRVEGPTAALSRAVPSHDGLGADHLAGAGKPMGEEA